MNIRMSPGASAALQGIAEQSRTERLVATLKRWWAAYRASRIEHAAVAELAALSDRDLKDIGITRSQIESAARGDVARERAIRRYY